MISCDCATVLLKTKSAMGNLKFSRSTIENSRFHASEKIQVSNGDIRMGKVKTEQIKHMAKELITRFPDKFSTSFDENKRMVSELTKGATTRVRNQIAGYITRTYILNQKGVPLQEDEIVLENTDET